MNIMSENVNELFTALSKAQGEFRLVKKSANNPFFKSKYADLASFIMDVREVLRNNDLCVTQTTISLNGNTFLVTTLGHKSGQWIQGTMPIVCSKNTPQEFGSSLTYARRYAFTSIINICGGDDDDDAQLAQVGVDKEHMEWVDKVEGIDIQDKIYGAKIRSAMARDNILRIVDMPTKQLKSIVASYTLFQEERKKKSDAIDFENEIKKEYI